MKRIWIAIAVPLILAAGPVRGDITGSAHDFSAQPWSGGQLCTICHTPHNAATAVSPLWHHESTTATFTLYSSATFTGTGTIAQPGGASKACLSCHDGTVALDAYGGNPGATYISGPALLDSDLRNDHPVSFTFDSALAAADGELHDPATTSSGLGGKISEDMLFASQLECASCHDVHNSAGQIGLLVKSNAGSALCLTCHNK